jgi:hypothetical protein
MRYVIYRDNNVIGAIEHQSLIVEYPNCTSRLANHLNEDVWQDLMLDPTKYQVDESEGFTLVKKAKKNYYKHKNIEVV